MNILLYCRPYGVGIGCEVCCVTIEAKDKGCWVCDPKLDEIGAPAVLFSGLWGVIVSGRRPDTDWFFVGHFKKIIQTLRMFQFGIGLSVLVGSLTRR